MAAKHSKGIRPPSIGGGTEPARWNDVCRESRIENIALGEETIEEDLYQTFSECEFTHVTCGGKAKNLLFMDVRIVGCDFSGAVFDETAFRRCEFERCRMLGTSLIRASFQDVRFEDCVLDYSNFSGSSWQSSALQNCSAKEAAFAVCRFQQLTFSHCSLPEAEFTDTKLADVDLSDSLIDGITVKAEDLKGVIASYDQAVVFAKLLGIQVKE